MKYAHIDNNNRLLGWYDKEIHTSIPTPNIEVSDDQWQLAIDNNHNTVTKDGKTSSVDYRSHHEIISERKQAKQMEIRGKFKRVLSTPIIIGDIPWDAGIESAQRLDFVVNKAKLGDDEFVIVYDSMNMPHKISIGDATMIVDTILTDFKLCFDQKQHLFGQIDKSTQSKQLDKIQWDDDHCYDGR